MIRLCLLIVTLSGSALFATPIGLAQNPGGYKGGNLALSNPGHLARTSWYKRIENGRRAIHQGKYRKARNIYAHMATKSTIYDKNPELRAEAFFRLALLEQRAGNFTGARDAFKCSVRTRPDPKIFTSWGLFEYKHGFGRRVAIALLQRAVHLDEAYSPVLQWRQFAENVPNWPSHC